MSLLILILLTSCLPPNPATSLLSEEIPPAEQPVTLIPLAGPLAGSQAEISGMAWYGETLVLLPQYPGRFGDSRDGAVFALPKAEILAVLDGVSTQPLQPQEIPFSPYGLVEKIPGFEGFEAITFSNDQVFLTVESRPGDMLGFLVEGTMAPDLSGLSLDPNRLAEIPPQADLANMTEEALLVAGDQLVAIFEANGRAVNPAPLAHLFDLSLHPEGTMPFPNIEYRITDVTPLDEQDRFWAINYFFPLDVHLQPQPDPLVDQYGEGPAHARSTAVERLIELQYRADRITFSGTPPIQIAGVDDSGPRNWEAIARLDERGFLLATDKFPQTLFAFVALP